MLAVRAYYDEGKFVPLQPLRIPKGSHAIVTILDSIEEESPIVVPTLAEQITAAIAKSNIPRIRLEADENGNAIIDKEKHPDLYDWAVNG